MRSTFIIMLALCAGIQSAPTHDVSFGKASPGEMKVLSEYFSLLGSKVQAGKQMAAAPLCDLSKAVMPVASSTPLPSPSAGLTLAHVAIGRGTQNYSCDATNSTIPPVAVGAVATLYNASCIAASYHDILTLLPAVTLSFNLSTTDRTLAPANLALSGHHFFTNSTTPFFSLDTAVATLGAAAFVKNSSTPAPTGAVIGQGGVGNGAVAWLRLTARTPEAGGLQEVFRVNTAGGNPPATCEGMADLFEIEYSAEYWFWRSPA